MRCGQPVFFKKSQPSDSDYFFIYIREWVGWVGTTHCVCISVNLSSYEATITAFKDEHHETIVLDDEEAFWIIEHKQALMNYSPSETFSGMTDVSTYRFKFMDNDTSNEFCIDGPCCGPIEDKLIDFISKFGRWL